jgi:hypothetical protein
MYFVCKSIFITIHLNVYGKENRDTKSYILGQTEHFLMAHFYIPSALGVEFGRKIWGVKIRF